MLRNLLGLGMILVTDAFRKGQQAAHDERPRTDNPFTEVEARWSDWNLGWGVVSKTASDNRNRTIALTANTRSPFEMGRTAASSGQSASMNPFHHGGPAHDQWRLGWASGKAA